MKSFLFLISVLLFCKSFVPLIDYAVNYEYITQELCENKNDKALHCNGKCHLVKQMAKSSEDENPISAEKINLLKEVMPLLKIELFTFKKHEFPKIKNILPVAYTNLYSYLIPKGIFHPPSFIFLN